MEQSPYSFFLALLNPASTPELFWLKVSVLFLLCCAGAGILYKMNRGGRKEKAGGVPVRIKRKNDVRDMLQEAADQKVHLQIKLQGVNKYYKSTILDIDQATVVIDALFPAEGNMQLQKSQTLQIEFALKDSATRKRSVPYSFNSFYQTQLELDRCRVLSIDMPETIERVQRRRHLRVVPPAQESLCVGFRLDGKFFNEKIADISGGGIGFYTNLDASALWVGRIVEPVWVNFTSISPVQCSVIIRSMKHFEKPVFIEGKPSLYYCGAEYVTIDEAARDEIVHYVFARQREQLRNIGREFA